MRQATPDVTRDSRRTRGLAILTALLLAGLIAAPAQAGSEFDDGFEDQLGRLVANEVFHLGAWVLAGGPGYVHTEYETRHHHDRHAHGHGHYKHQRRHHYRHRGRHHHSARRKHYWRQHYGHDHAYGSPCEVVYERHEVRRRDRYAGRW